MFTTIQLLRQSSAQQSRVEVLERALLKLNPNWNALWVIPVIFVAKSNNGEDFWWVRDNKRVETAPGGWTDANSEAVGAAYKAGATTASGNYTGKSIEDILKVYGEQLVGIGKWEQGILAAVPTSPSKPAGKTAVMRKPTGKTATRKPTTKTPTTRPAAPVKSMLPAPVQRMPLLSLLKLIREQCQGRKGVTLLKEGGSMHGKYTITF